MDISGKPKESPGEAWWDLIIRAVVVWGTALMIAELTNHALIGVIPRGPRMLSCLILILLLVGGFFWGGETWPRLRDGFYSLRIPIAMVLAIYVGYQWHASDYAKSEEARLNEATRKACATSQLCQKRALGYLAAGQ